MDFGTRKNKVIPVILSGGSGTRLWPSSRSARPKQFVELIGDQTLFEMTLSRVRDVSFTDPIVVCNESHRFLVAEQCAGLGIESAKILLEPAARNTAHTAVEIAASEAINGSLVTFGIPPEGPETGYGYIKAASEGVASVSEFVEKPDVTTAEKFLASADNYYWNSGIFVFTARDFLRELEHFKPDILRLAKEAFDARQSDLDFERIAVEAFKKCESISIDYAVMENSSLVRVVPMTSGWSDLGVWSSVHKSSTKDENGNALHGDTCVVDSKNCLVHGNGRLISVLGCENIAVIETPDSVAVLNMDSSQDVKKVVEALAKGDRDEVSDHSCVYRPWGNYESIDVGNRYQVKRLIVKPGARLSLQKHHHRAEHWVVVRGTAKITRGKEEFMLSENQSTYIPLGEMHRLENPGSIDLELIEVQSGSYLGEDDIVRVDDEYGRVTSIRKAS